MGVHEEVRQIFIDFKKAYDSVRREVLYKILIEFGIPKKLVRLIKMSLTEIFSRVPISNGLRQRHWEGSGKPGWLESKWYTSASGLCR